MEGITDEMETWLNNLFQVGIERGLELDTIQKCLIFMEGHILALINATQDPHYYDACFECHVYGPKFAIRYDGSPDYVLANFWRDLLLIAIVEGDKVVLANFKAHKADIGKTARASWLKESLCNLLPYTPDPAQGKDPDEERLGAVDWQNSWHTDAMRAAVPCLRAFLQE